MTKKEKIKEAYGDRFESLKEFINLEGIFVGATEMITDDEFKEWSFIASASPIGKGKNVAGSRPKSLKGIENNNGWIKIESEDDLPKEHMAVFLYEPIDGIGFGSWCNLQIIFKTRFGNEYKPVTHYQPIEKPKPPIY